MVKFEGENGIELGRFLTWVKNECKLTKTLTVKYFVKALGVLEVYGPLVAAIKLMAETDKTVIEAKEKAVTVCSLSTQEN